MTTSVAALRAEGPAMGSFTFDDAAVEFAIDALDRMDILSSLRTWRDAERTRLGRHAGGAPEKLSTEAVAVAAVIAALHDMPLHLRTFRDILFCNISPAMRTRLAVPDPPDAHDQLAWEALERRVARRVHALLDPIDPSPLPKNRSLDPVEFDAAIAKRIADGQLTDAVLAERSERLAWLVNQPLEASHTYLPRDIRRRWKGSVVVDATNVPAFARMDARETGKQPRDKRKVLSHSADPDAGLYIRTDGDPAAGPRAKGTKKVIKSVWAYEASLIVTAAEETGTGYEYPNLVIGMAPLHRPAHEPGKNAITGLASVNGRGHPAGWLAGDRAYTHALGDDFQLPARSLGYKPVLDYRYDQLGVKDSFAGALMIEGAWYSPGITQPLIEATIDLRDGRIDSATWRTRIKARRAYRLRVKDTLPDGQVKMMCPAAGTSPTAICELKPESDIPKNDGKLRIHVVDELLIDRPKICDQKSVNFPPDAGSGQAAKLRQDLHYGSKEWHDHFNRLRNTIEGINGTAKDGAHSALDDPERRRVRGVAAQSFFAALLLFATNIRKINSFLTHIKIDADGVARRPRKSRRKTKPLASWVPPTVALAGAPPP